MALKAADNKREERNDLQTLTYDCMRDYRAKAALLLPPSHALQDSLPALSPDASQKPDAPEGSGVWNAVTENADLTAVPCISPTVVRTELRYSPDDSYNETNDIVLVSIPEGEPLTFSTAIGLGVSGDTARFTWVALTANGHEGMSNVVEVERTS